MSPDLYTIPEGGKRMALIGLSLNVYIPPWLEEVM